jgi:aminomethyltransferase
MGYCLYGNDIDDTTSPLEAGLVGSQNSQKIYWERNIRKAKEGRLERKLVGFEMIEKGIPRMDIRSKILSNPYGVVTSGTQSPSLNKAIGMGYVQSAFTAIDSKNLH